MSRLFSLLRSTTGSRTPLQSNSLNASPCPSTAELVAREMVDIDEAMEASSLVMNDDIAGAEARLSQGDSAFHLLAMGVCTFMRSVLGFEKEMMNQASARLVECETKAWAELKRAQKEDNRGMERLYPPGSEYLLVQSEAQVMGAIISVLHESLSEGIKGFYKLRKAFIALDGLMEAEAKALRERQEAKRSGNVLSTDTDAAAAAAAAADDDDYDVSGSSGPWDSNPGSDSSSTSGSDNFVDAPTGLETPPGNQLPSMDDAALDKKLETLRRQSGVDTPSQLPSVPHPSTLISSTSPESKDEAFSDSLDAYVHSGANMCFGILLLIISMVPPAFSKLLYVIGFKGDRDRGLKMLWQSTKFRNVNGAIAGLVLLTYYNGQLSFGDILRRSRDLENGDHDVNGWPAARCVGLLESMRQRYPDSGLWKLEEARGLSNAKQLDKAIEVLQSNMKSKMRQVVALNNFELSLSAMFSRNWPLMKECFLRCVELNDWSHALYYYIAACAEVEMYRDAVADGDEVLARQKKKSAEDLLRKAPTVAGKKRFLARQMPFEVFVVHKVAKWEERSKRTEVDLVDTIGVSPAGEMSFLWNGCKKMNAEELEKAKGDLAIDRLTAPDKERQEIAEEPDEKALRAVSLASLETERGRWEEGRRLLLPFTEMDRNVFRGPNRDDFVLPSVFYQLAVIAWCECCEAEESFCSGSPSSSTTTTPDASRLMAPGPDSVKSGKLDSGSAQAEERIGKIDKASSQPEKPWPNGTRDEADAFRKEKALECLSLLEKVARWESFILDARMGLRVQTGLDNVRWLISKRGWA